MVLQLEHWTVGLKLNTESRCPPVERVVPTLSADATRLKELLDRVLPVQSSKSSMNHHPLTIDLTGDVPIVRCRSNHSEQATEIRLTRSSRHGKPGRVCLDARFLVSALEMGFHNLGFHQSDSPVRLDRHQRVYILMPLHPDNLIPPGDHHVIATGLEPKDVDQRPAQELGSSPSIAELVLL